MGSLPNLSCCREEFILVLAFDVSNCIHILFPSAILYHPLTSTLLDFSSPNSSSFCEMLSTTATQALILRSILGVR